MNNLKVELELDLEQIEKIVRTELTDHYKTMSKFMGDELSKDLKCLKRVAKYYGAKKEDFE